MTEFIFAPGKQQRYDMDMAEKWTAMREQRMTWKQIAAIEGSSPDTVRRYVERVLHARAAQPVGKLTFRDRPEYKPLRDPRMVEAIQRAGELKAIGESLYD